MNYQLPSLLILILVCTNGAPIIARKLLSSRFETPMDGNLVLRDGQRLLGSSKTIRGVVAGTLTSTAMFMILGMAVLNGFVFGLSAMLGDSLSSFVKRRARLNSGDSVCSSSLHWCGSDCLLQHHLRQRVTSNQQR